jgi:N-acetylneuraminate synthase/N,N'-diacetyllegionaminate synthase
MIFRKKKILNKNFKKIYFIAEIGVNHNGNLALAKKMILAAKKSGADAVKFQTFKAEDLVTPKTQKVKYQKSTTSPEETHYEMIKSLELSEKNHIMIKNFCKKKNIDFISTPYGIKSAKFLNKIKCEIFKTASADIVDLEMHEYLAKKNKPVLISTGMATMKEIKECVDIYRKYKNNKFILLHCVSNYPCSLASLNLNVLIELKNTFKCKIGYSDHSIGNDASTLSVALGAKVIEKHFTINKKLKGPDQLASILPKEFSEMVQNVNKSVLILGKNEKKCQREEFQMSKVSRKSITFNQDIKKNMIIKKNYLTLKRPGTGLLFNSAKKIIGKKAKKNFVKNYQPNFRDFY